MDWIDAFLFPALEKQGRIIELWCFFFVRDTCFFSARQVLDPEMSNAKARSQEWKRLEDEHNKLSKEMRDGGH